jgi:RNA polymerase-binding transcription factor DksA
MSKNRGDDELLEEFQRMLDAYNEEDDDEEDVYPFPYLRTWGHSTPDQCESSGESASHKGNKKTKCRHKRLVKKHLFSSHYMECEDCGEEIK